jgi:hypothetical protein
MTDSQQFFNLAALIIPVLLFGGAVSQTWRPTGDKSRAQIHKLTAAVWTTMVFAIVAEVIAIIAAVGGEPGLGERIVVGVAVVAGTVAAAGAVLWPWLEKLTDPKAKGRDKESGQLQADKRWRALAILIGVIVGIGLTPILLLNAAGTRGSGSQSKQIEKEALKLARAQRQSAEHLDEFAKANAAAQRTLQQTIHTLTAEMARIRAENERR